MPHPLPAPAILRGDEMATEAEIEAAKNAICGWMDCQASCAGDSPEERACVQLARLSLIAAERVRANANQAGGDDEIQFALA